MSLAPTTTTLAPPPTIATAVTCGNEDARKMYVRAWGHMLNYNHEQAIACFSHARARPGLCDGLVGHRLLRVLQLQLGALGSGYDAIQQALRLKGGVNERDLIEALATRSSAEARDNADPTALNMGNTPELNLAFAEAMAPLYDKYKGNLDTAVYVEALMNLNPWQLWNKNTATGEITPVDDNTLLLIRVMEEAFETVAGATEHPALCHLYCHALELSPYPERALPAADVLRTLMPGCGHLVHMPSHIDAWVGQWKEAIDCNIAAVRPTTATSRRAATSRSSTSSTGCTTTTSWCGAPCSMGSTRPR